MKKSKKTLRNSDPRAEVQETFRSSDPHKKSKKRSEILSSPQRTSENVQKSTKRSPKTFRVSDPYGEVQKKHSEILVLKENTKKIRNSVPR